MEPITVIILLLFGVPAGILMLIALAAAVFFSILRSTNQTIFGFGASLTLPALLAMLFRFQLHKEKMDEKTVGKESLDEELRRLSDEK